MSGRNNSTDDRNERDSLEPTGEMLGMNVSTGGIAAGSADSAQSAPLTLGEDSPSGDGDLLGAGTGTGAEAGAGAGADSIPAPGAQNHSQQPGNNDGGSKAVVAASTIKKKMVVDPAKLLEPIRTDPIKSLEARKRRLDRQVGLNMPEIHYIGQIVSVSKVLNDPTEGAFCRWKFDHGKAWELLDGDLAGQTQVGYCSINEHEAVPLSHPIDVHFAAAGLQGWGAPRLSMQCYRLDWHGRRVLAGYGFVHLPMASGAHRLEINLWRPVGTPDQELASFLLGEAPALINHEPIYEAAWKDRCRLLTVASGKVVVEVFVVSRNLDRQSIDK